MRSRTFWTPNWNKMAIRFYVNGTADIRKGETLISLTEADLKIFLEKLDELRETKENSK